MQWFALKVPRLWKKTILAGETTITKTLGDLMTGSKNWTNVIYALLFWDRLALRGIGGRRGTRPGRVRGRQQLSLVPFTLTTWPERVEKIFNTFFCWTPMLIASVVLQPENKGRVDRSYSNIGPEVKIWRIQLEMIDYKDRVTWDRCAETHVYIRAQELEQLFDASSIWNR